MRKLDTTTLNSIVDEAISNNQIVGTNIIVSQYGSVIFERSAGLANRDKQQAVNQDTVFRLASMTKPLVSAAAMALVEQGVIDLASSITRWLPKFQPKLANGEMPEITVRHLLTHTAGLAYGFMFEDNEPYFSAGISDGIDESVLSVEENLKRLASVPLGFEPGNGWCYSLATDVLGAILEQVCQKSLPEIVEQYVTGPLSMADTTFYLHDSNRVSQAYASQETASPRPMEAEDQVRLEGCGMIYYAPGRIANTDAYPSGGAGMAGTAQDYMKFLEAIRAGGAPILKETSVEQMTQDMVSGFDVPAAGPGFGFGMGFAVLRDSEEAETPKNAGTYEWGGVYGTSMFIDPSIGLSVVVLTNTALEGLVGAFPADMTRAIYEALA